MPAPRCQDGCPSLRCIKVIAAPCSSASSSAQLPCLDTAPVYGSVSSSGYSGTMPAARRFHLATAALCSSVPSLVTAALRGSTFFHLAIAALCGSVPLVGYSWLRAAWLLHPVIWQLVYNHEQYKCSLYCYLAASI